MYNTKGKSNTTNTPRRQSKGQENEANYVDKTSVGFAVSFWSTIAASTKQDDNNYRTKTRTSQGKTNAGQDKIISKLRQDSITGQCSMQIVNAITNTRATTIKLTACLLAWLPWQVLRGIT
jgi:hypothetical protein